MPASISEIRHRITSQNIDVLRQSLEFVRRCLVQENERGKAAETRATVMLGILGVIATLVIPSAKDLTRDTEPTNEQWFLLVCFVSCLLFLTKGLYYAIRTISISKGYRVQPSMVFDLQNGSHVEAVRAEISGIIWEYDQSIQYNNGKLFWLQRCQRSSCVSILILVLFDLGSIETFRHWIDISTCIPLGLSALFIILFFFLDLVSERMGGIWESKHE